jgi:DNA-binding GntR family transcriptional regulator
MARTPLYKAAETEMIRRIEAGEWEVGKRLPNEFVLAEEFKVSQGTMRRALMTLEGMGLLNRKPGRGTLVAKPGGRPFGQRRGARNLSGGALSPSRFTGRNPVCGAPMTPKPRCSAQVACPMWNAC